MFFLSNCNWCVCRVVVWRPLDISMFTFFWDVLLDFFGLKKPKGATRQRGAWCHLAVRPADLTTTRPRDTRPEQGLHMQLLHLHLHLTAQQVTQRLFSKSLKASAQTDCSSLWTEPTNADRGCVWLMERPPHLSLHRPKQMAEHMHGVVLVSGVLMPTLLSLCPMREVGL